MTRCFSRHCCLRSTASARQSDAHEIASSVLSPLDLALLSPLQSTAPATLKEAHFAQLTICIWHFGIAKTDVYFYLLQDLWLVRALHICTSSRLWRSLFNIEGLPRLFRNVHDFIEMNTHLHHHHLSSSFIIFHHLSTPIFHIYPYLPLGHGLKAPGEPRASLMLAFQVQHVIALVSLVRVPGRKKEGKMKENGQENGA
jgi:hypothetical protein